MDNLQFLLAYYYPLISRYSGWGTGDLGAHLAGFFTLFAADTEKHARESFRLNHPHSPIFNLDLEYLNPLKMLEYAGIKLNDIFVYLVTAPCQGISKAGVQKIYDVRNQMMLNEPYIISKVRPAAFVFENVNALFDNNMAYLMNELIREVNEHLGDYDVYYMELNAASFGVPQSRKRFIMYGLRKDLNIEPFAPEITQERPTSIKDVMPEVNKVYYGYNDARVRDSSQVGPTMTRTPNLKLEIDGKLVVPNKEQINLYCGSPRDYQSSGSVIQHFNRAGNGFLAPMSNAIFKPLFENMKKAGLEPTHISELLKLTEVSVPLSLRMEMETRQKKINK